MKKFILVFLLLATPAFADTCYFPPEMEAEQLIRLHSELMVITFACKQGSQGQDLEPIYNGFTEHNVIMLHEAEQTLLRYFRARYNENDVHHLDTLRTKLGNEIAQQAANESAPLFCKKYRDKVVTFFYATPEQVKEEVKRLAKTKKPYNPLCKYATPMRKTKAAMDKKSS